MPLSQQSAHGGHKSQRLIEHQVMACSRNSDYLDVFSAKIVHEIPRVTCEQQAFLAMDDRLAAWRRHKFRADCKPIGARRSDERRVGKAGVSTSRTRWSPEH